MSLLSVQASFLLLLLLVASGSASTVVTKLLMTTSSTGAACSGLNEGSISDSNNCDGGFEKTLNTAGNLKHNVIPQQDAALRTLLRYEGSLAIGKYISLVDQDLSVISNNPCSPVEAGHPPDQTHSGPMLATTDGEVGSPAGKVVKLDQSSAGVLLTSTKIYAVCYSTGTGTQADTFWAYADIQVKISRLSRIEIYGQPFRTCGYDRPCVIPNHPLLTLRYFGTIDPDRWVSFVDSTLNNEDPCGSGAVAAAWEDATHTGSILAVGNVLSIDTAKLSAAHTLSVCYSESGGHPGAAWIDAGLRFKRSAITSMVYGVDTARVGTGVEYAAWNRNTDDNDLVATDRLPRRAGTTKVKYSGELESTNHNAFVSLVEASLGRGQPCNYPQIASGSADGAHSGKHQAALGVVSLVNLNALDLMNVTSGALKVYAVCYATGTGDANDLTWSDSYIRYSMSSLESVQHHMAIHATSGMIPLQDSMEFTFEGDLSLGSGNTTISLVTEQLPAHLVTNPNGVQSYEPCGSSLLSGSVNSDFTSGQAHPLVDGWGKSRFTLQNVTQLNTGTIVTVAGKDAFARGDPLITNSHRREYTGSEVNALRARGRYVHVFAVCYKEPSHSQHYDSGIRLTVSKMSKITHGKTQNPYKPFSFFPGPATYELPWSGQANARQVIPASPNQQITYYAEPTAGTHLSTGRPVALVDSSLNTNKPCLGAVPWTRTVDASESATSQQSGAVKADAGTQIVTIPQTVVLDHQKTFAVCYAITDGSSADETWQDSYIRLRVSQVESIVSLGVTHKVNDFVATIAYRTSQTTGNPEYYPWYNPSKLPMVYAGALPGGHYLSFVDQTLNSNFPCASDAVASGQSGSASGLGSVQASGTSFSALFDTSSLHPNYTYAICYGTGLTSGYFDSGIRVQRSKVEKLLHYSGYSTPAARELTTVDLDTNRIPALNFSDWRDDVVLEYRGTSLTSSSLWFSFVAANTNGNDPCVNPTMIQGNTSGSDHSGALSVQSGTSLSAPQSADSLAHGKFAVCYATLDGGPTDSTYRDSYIRLTITKLAALEHSVGKYTDSSHTPGRTIRHRTAGHLPSVDASSHVSLHYTVTGTLAASAQVSLVADSYMTGTNGFRQPCTKEVPHPSWHPSRPADTTSTGPLTMLTSTTFAANTMNLNVSETYALCYTEDSWITSYDSGLRFTISKITNVVYRTPGSPNRDNTPLFLPTNRLAQTMTQQLQYEGDSSLLAQFVSIVADNLGSGRTAPGIDGTGNPCADPSVAQAGSGASNSGVIQLETGHTCTTLDEYRLSAGTPMTTGPVGYANRVSAGDVVADWETCLAACEGDHLCFSVVFNKVTRECFPSSTNPAVENTTDYGAHRSDFGAGKWISATCSGVGNTANFIPPHDQSSTDLSLDPGNDYKTTFALCYTEHMNSGTSDKWRDSYIRFRITPLGALETSGTSHWTTGQAPIVGVPVAFDYFASSLDHHFVWKGQASSGHTINFINSELNSGYPCTASNFASTSPSKFSTNASVARGDADRNHLLDTTGLDTSKLYAVCAMSANGVFDSGIRLTISKVKSVLLASGHTGPSNHDAVEPRVMTTKAAVTNTFPRQPNQVLTVVPSAESQSLHSGTVYISLVASTLNSGKPCVGADAYAAADATHSGPVLANQGLAATIPQATLLGPYDDTKFRVCYGVNNSGASGNWQDSYITLKMTDITSLNVHTPSVTGLRATASDSTETVMKIRTVGQIPSQRGSLTTRYSVDSGDPSISSLYISLVDASENVVNDTLSGTNAYPTLNSGYARSDPCRSLQHTDSNSVSGRSWTAWKTSRGTANAAHGEISGGMMSDMDTTLINSTKLFALCYSKLGKAFFDSGIRITVPQVVGVLYSDVQMRADRTREITSVVKAYNTLPLIQGNIGLRYIGEYSGKEISLVEHTSNGGNPCVSSTVAAQAVSSNANSELTLGAYPVDTIYALCYGTTNSALELQTGSGNDYWIRNGRAGTSTFRDSYIRVFGSEIQNVTAYGITFNIRGQIPGHRELKLGYAPTQSLMRIALVHETLNPLTVGATTLPFPCSHEFGTNAQGPIKDPTTTSCQSTSNCTHTGSLTNNPGLSEVTMDTTDLDPQKMYALCYNSDSSDNSKWRDSAIRLTVPEIQVLAMSSGHTGTPNRLYKSWDTASSTAVLDRPTSRLPASPGVALLYHKHLAASNSRTDGASFAIVKVDYSPSSSPNSRKNPCPAMSNSVWDAAPQGASAVCSGSDQCSHSGEMTGSSNGITVPQASGELLARTDGDPESGTFTMCYKSVNSNDGVIESNMHTDPNTHTQTNSLTQNTVFWEDSYVRFKISALASIAASGVTHVTTGQLPNTAAEDLSTWGQLVGRQPQYPFAFKYNSSTMADDRFISLVDATLSPQPNGEGLPCSDSTSAAVAGLDNQAVAGSVTTWDTTSLDPSKVYALCYDASNNANSGSSAGAWSDSGIRLTVPAVHAVLYDSGHSGPTNKEDTRPRPMTSTVLPTNTFPRGSSASLTYVGTLETNKYISLVLVSQSSTKNPCLDPANHAASNAGNGMAVRSGPTRAGSTNKLVTITSAPNEELVSGNDLWAVCYDGGDSAPTFTHSPECCGFETNAAAYATCMSACSSSLVNAQGTSTSFTWRDSFIRLRVVDVQALRIHTGINSNTAQRRTIDIVTNGGIPATATQKQVTFEYRGSLDSNSDNSTRKVRLVDSSLYNTLVADDTGISHKHPCEKAADVLGATQGSPQKQATWSTKKIHDLDTSVLSTITVYALCSTTGNGAVATEWQDSGIRVTVSKLQSLHYLGDVPYTPQMLANEQALLSLRNRPWTSSKTALNRLPRTPNIMLRWDGHNSGWPSERASSPAGEFLADGSHVSIVSLGSSATGNPCADPGIAAGAGGYNSGVMTGTDLNSGPGMWVQLNQHTLLQQSSATGWDYAVCYAEGNGSATDITWRDSFIRLETSDVSGLTQAVQAEDTTFQGFNQEYKTTGQLADSSTLALTYEGLSAGKSLMLIDETTYGNAEEVGLDSFFKPCGLATSPAQGNRSSGSLTATGRTVTVDTSALHREHAGAEVIYAVCYKSGLHWEDSAIRLSITQVQQLLYRSGYDRGTAYNTKALTATGQAVYDGGSLAVTHDYYDMAYGIDTKKDTMARHLTSSYSEKNRLQLMPSDIAYATPAASHTVSYVTVPNSLMADVAGQGASISFVAESEGTSYASPCDLVTKAGATTATSRLSGVFSASAGTKVIVFNSTQLTEIQKYAVCYRPTSSLTAWRDSYIRFKFSKVRSIQTAGVETFTYGQIPRLSASSELEFNYFGALPAGMHLSLVKETTNSFKPCVGQHAAAAPTADLTGQQQAGAHAQTVTTFDTMGLNWDIELAVCYAEGDGSASDATWFDSGIRVTVSAIYAVTLPFDNNKTDSCRAAGHTCTHADREMTAYPAPTNRLPRLDQRVLTYSTAGQTGVPSPYFSIVDASLNFNNPCVDPSIPGTSDVSFAFSAAGSTANNKRQVTVATQSSNNQVTIPQAANNLLHGRAQAVMSSVYNTNLGKSYAVCYSVAPSGNDTDVGWRDSYIRLVLTEIALFGTKQVEFFTNGVIPHHDSGLEYYYGMDASSPMAGAANSKRFLSLVEVVETWEDPVASGLEAVVSSSNLKMVSFQVSATQTPAGSMPVDAGYRIRIGSEVRTVVYTTGTYALVSVSFTQAYAGAQFWIVDNSMRGVHSGEGFANKPFDPCTCTSQSAPCSNNLHGMLTDLAHVQRAEPAGSLAAGATINGIRYHSLNSFKTTSMKQTVDYALCYSANVNDGDSTTDDWFDSGLRVQVSELTALEYSGHKRGVIGFPTAYNLLDGGYTDVGSGDCTGISITSYYYYEARATDAECKAQCNKYSDCLGYQASSEAVPGYGGREKHCKIWKAADASSAITSVGASWGNSICRKKTAGSDEITRGLNHRKMQSVLAPLQPALEVTANVLPMNTTLDVVYAGTLPASKYIAIVALGSSTDTSGADPCGDAFHPATASATSSGPMKSCESIGPGYTDTVPGAQYPRSGGMCKPSGTVCADEHAAIMKKLHETGCPNTDKRFMNPAFMGLAEMADWGGRATQFAAICNAVAAGTSTAYQQAACCGQNDDGSLKSCLPSCVTPSSNQPDCAHDVSTQGNKEVSFNMAIPLNENAGAGYTVCYTNGDGSATDTNWKDSYVRVKLSKVTAIVASGVTHHNHGHLASHDSITPLEVEYRGNAVAPGLRLAFVKQELGSNDPCAVPAIAGGTDPTVNGDEYAISDSGDSSQKVRIMTSHLNVNYTFAVCYQDTSWHDSGIRVRVSMLTNVRYNMAQAPSPQYIRDMTSSRVRIAPADDFFTEEASGYGNSAEYEDIRNTVATHTLPTPNNSAHSVTLSYLGSLPDARHVAFVETSQNFGDPCVLGSVINAGADSLRSASVLSSAGKTWDLAASIVSALDPLKTYSLCYDSGSNASQSDDPNYQNQLALLWDQGLGVPVPGWRDSFIRFTISKIDHISSHSINHYTQGLLAYSNLYTVGISGTLPAGRHIALISETENSWDPCRSHIAVSSVPSASSNSTGAVPTGVSVGGGVSADIDTTGLNTDNNFAVCYHLDDGWKDSGIRVWISKVEKLTYNQEQPTEVSSGVYERDMKSSNHATLGASDSNPVATNRLPLTGVGGGSFKFKFTAIPANGAGLSATTQFSFIDASLNSGTFGPCASAAVAGVPSDSTHLKPSASVSNEITLDTSGAHGAHSLNSVVMNGAQIAVCYFDTSPAWRGSGGNTHAGQWRDSHIRLVASKVYSIESYGIVHKTTGMVSHKGSLRIRTVGTLNAAGLIRMVNQNFNTHQPCTGLAASVLPSGVTTDLSTSNANNGHYLNTVDLDPTVTYALCYAEGDGSTSDNTYADSGIRLTTPQVTTLSYSAPERTITSTSCFSGDLWGAADCNADPAHTCSGPSCTGGDPSMMCHSSATQTCSMVPRSNSPSGNGISYKISSDQSSTAQGVTFVSFVLHTRGAQGNNPCRDATEASAAATTASTLNQREHSGPLAVTQGAFTLHQLNDQLSHSNLLKEDGTFALCYTTGNGGSSDAQWRDSYIRITLSKITQLQASDMTVTTRGMFANVPSLRVSWFGSLGMKKWINLVEVTDNNNVPCNKANAESFQQCTTGCAFDSSQTMSTSTQHSAANCKIKCIETSTCAAYTFHSDTMNCYLFTAANAYQGTTNYNLATAYSGVLDAAFKQSGWLQAASAEQFVDFDTTSLTADVLYTVCYADQTGTPSTGAPPGSAAWTDSAIRLRFIKWTNPHKNRVVSGAATLLSFSINHGTFDPAHDVFAMIRGATDCSSAPTAPLLSNGTQFKRAATLDLGAYTATNTSTWGFALPSGSGASYRATAWRRCRPVLQGPERLDMQNYEACDEPGMYQDNNLQEGNYMICFCDSDNGNSGCDSANEFVELSSSSPPVSPGILTVVQTPRLGRADMNFNASSHVGAVRGLHNKSHTYNIKTTATAGLEVANGDLIFFKDTACDAVPAADSGAETAPIAVSGFDNDVASLAYKSGRVVTPSVTPLTSNGNTPRPLVSCFGTKETSQTPYTLMARDFVKLADGLEIAPKPRLGSNMLGDADSVIRSLSGQSPTFEAKSLRAGDKLFFKQMNTFSYQLTGFLKIASGNNVLCDYQNSEFCSCDSSGALSCSNPAHLCTGFSCTNVLPEGHDTDCTDGNIAVDGTITNSLLASNRVDGTAPFPGFKFFDSGVSGQTVVYTVTLTNDWKYAINGNSQEALSGSTGNTYVFNLDSASLNDHPFLLSSTEGGEHNGADFLVSEVVFKLNGAERTPTDYLKYFGTATTRSITYTPTAKTMVWYYSHANDDANVLTHTRSPLDPHTDENTYRRTEMGAQMSIAADDSGIFQLPTDTPLTSVDATTPRFLTACFIPAGAVETLHSPSTAGAANCSYSSPHDTTCTRALVNAHRLEDYLQVLPEPTLNLKLQHNQSEVFSLKFNLPAYGTFWRSTGQWCTGDPSTHPCGVSQSDRGLPGTSALCCQAPPNFAGGSPGDVVVLKKELTRGSGDCVGVEGISDGDYFIGAQYSRKMSLTSIDDDRSSQTSPRHPDISQGILRHVSEKGAEASHDTLADGKVNELPEGFYTICYATAESGGGDSADFKQLSVSLEILPKSMVGPSLEVARTVLLGHNINVRWSPQNGYHTSPAEAHSWIGLFREGECPNGENEFQNKCYLAAQAVTDGEMTGGVVTFKPQDYKLTTGTYEVRYFEGTSRDEHGVVCKGIPNSDRHVYMTCTLESVVTSSPITVYSGVENMDSDTDLPGLEFVFDGKAARFAGQHD